MYIELTNLLSNKELSLWEIHISAAINSLKKIIHVLLIINHKSVYHIVHKFQEQNWTIWKLVFSVQTVLFMRALWICVLWTTFISRYFLPCRKYKIILENFISWRIYSKIKWSCSVYFHLFKMIIHTLIQALYKCISLRLQLI